MQYNTQKLSEAVRNRLNQAQEPSEAPIPSHLAAIIQKRATAASDASNTDVRKPIKQAFLGKSYTNSNAYLD